MHFRKKHITPIIIVLVKIVKTETPNGIKLKVYRFLTAICLAIIGRKQYFNKNLFRAFVASGVKK